MSSQAAGQGGLNPVLSVLAWLWVVVPFLYGLFFLLIRLPGLFTT